MIALLAPRYLFILICYAVVTNSFIFVQVRGGWTQTLSASTAHTQTGFSSLHMQVSSLVLNKGLNTLPPIALPEQLDTSIASHQNNSWNPLHQGSATFWGRVPKTPATSAGKMLVRQGRAAGEP